MFSEILNKHYKIDFLQYRKLFFSVSIILVVCSFILLGFKGLNKGIDFTGGILIEAKFESEPDMSLLREKFNSIEIGDVSLQDYGAKDLIVIRVGLDSGVGEKEQIAKINKIKDYLNTEYDNNIDYRRVDFVGPTVGGELVKSGILALIYAFLAILIYIWIRFNYHFGIGALAALIHDVIIVFGFYSLMGLEFNLTSIAAILTIIGYSINDSVVIYDRIRENFRKYRSKKIADVINLSLNETLNRTVLTAVTTILALASLAILGGPVLKSFSLGVLFGVVIGTYSSIYVAAPIVNNKNSRKVK